MNGQEVGRSSILLKYQGRTIILLTVVVIQDKNDPIVLSFFDAIDNSEEIDLVQLLIIRRKQ